MKKILVIMMVLLWITSAWSGAIFDAGGNSNYGAEDTVFCQFSCLEPVPNVYSEGTAIDTVFILIKHHKTVELALKVSDMSVFMAHDVVGFRKFFDFMWGSTWDDADSSFQPTKVGMWRWWILAVDYDGTQPYETMTHGWWQVNPNPLSDMPIYTDFNDPTEAEIYSHFISGTNEDQFKAIVTNLDVAVSTRLAPSTAGRTLDITTTGEAGIDLGNTNGNFVAGDFGAGCLDGKGNWNIGKTNYILASTGLNGVIQTSGEVLADIRQLNNVNVADSSGHIAASHIVGGVTVTTNNDKTDYSLLSSQWSDHRTALNSAHGSGSWATAVNFSTHSAADVYTHFTTGSNADAFMASTPLNFTSLSITAGGLANVNVEQIDSSGTAADYLRDILSGVARTLTLSNYSSFQDKASQSDIQAGLTAQGYTSGRAPYLDNINHGIPSSANYTSGRAANLDYLDIATSTRLATSAAPTNFSLLSINGSGYVTTTHSLPSYFSAMKISSGGYVAPDFTDINGSLDSLNNNWRQMFSMQMHQYSTNDSGFGYANNPENFVDSSTYYDWSKVPLDTIIVPLLESMSTFLGACDGCTTFTNYGSDYDVLYICGPGNGTTRDTIFTQTYYHTGGANGDPPDITGTIK
jgi:hypothetical protein